MWKLTTIKGSTDILMEEQNPIPVLLNAKKVKWETIPEVNPSKKCPQNLEKHLR